RHFVLAALLTLPLFCQMLWTHTGHHGQLPLWLQCLLAGVVQIGLGWPFYVSSYRSLRGGSANMDVLIALGTTAAYGFSLAVYAFSLDEHVYFESSAMIITLVLMGRWLESVSKGRASDAIRKLLELQPKTAKVRKGDEWVEISVDEIKVGDLFLVR